jgi:hypothetical protein
MDNHERVKREPTIRWKGREVCFECLPRDICQGEVFVVTSQVVPLKHVIQLELPIGKESAVRYFGGVIWVNRGQVETLPPGFRVEFRDLGDDSLTLLSDFCAELE